MERVVVIIIVVVCVVLLVRKLLKLFQTKDMCSSCGSRDHCTKNSKKSEDAESKDADKDVNDLFQGK